MPPEFDLDRHSNGRENRPPLEIENIPSEILTYPQWVLWRYVDRGPGKKPDKQPVNPKTLGNAGVHWTNTWGSFEQTLATYIQHQERGIAGIGFVLTLGDPFVGIDMDACVKDGTISEGTQEVMDKMASYTELSPSLRGLRILASCPEYTQNMRTFGLEVYSHKRFLTVTGHHVEGTPATIASLEKEVIATLAAPSLPPPGARDAGAARHTAVPADGMTLWTRIFEHDQYGAQHWQRFHGDMSFDRGDHSLAVIRLLNCLARWTQGDAGKMREMVLLSPLSNDKWFSKRGTGDWLDHQIADAIAYVQGGK